MKGFKNDVLQTSKREREKNTKQTGVADSEEQLTGRSTAAPSPSKRRLLAVLVDTRRIRCYHNLVMGSREDKSISDLKEGIFHKFRDFMTGITKIDESGTAGSRLLSGFQQAFEFIRKPPIDTNSKLVNKIIIANETKRLTSYVNAGCRKPNDDVQSTINSKGVLNELEDLLADVTSAIQSIHGNLSALSDLDFDVKVNEQATYNDLEENTAFSHSQSTDVTTTKIKENTDVTHLAALMAIIYSMVKQDYLMQERVVSALDLKLSTEELESYCKMWSLRPFINDEIVHQAWEYIH